MSAHFNFYDELMQFFFINQTNDNEWNVNVLQVVNKLILNIITRYKDALRKYSAECT